MRRSEGSDIYTPTKIPEMEIEFDFELGQAQTWHQPGYDTEITITNIKINGDYVSEQLFDLLIESAGDKWIDEILALEVA